MNAQKHEYVVIDLFDDAGGDPNVVILAGCEVGEGKKPFRLEIRRSRSGPDFFRYDLINLSNLLRELKEESVGDEGILWYVTFDLSYVSAPFSTFQLPLCRWIDARVFHMSLQGTDLLTADEELGIRNAVPFGSDIAQKAKKFGELLEISRQRRVASPAVLG